MYNNEQGTVLIKKGLYTYCVKKSDDSILFYTTPSKENQTVPKGVTFEQMFGYKAVDHKVPAYQKQKQFRPNVQQNTNNKYQNNRKFNNQNNYKKTNFNKNNNSKQFKSKILYKTNFHKRTIYYPDSIEGFLAINNKLYPENQPKDVKIIASFANMINYDEIKDFKFFLIKHRTNIGHIKVLENNKLVAYENPLANVNIGFIVEQLSRFVDVIFAPANDSYIEELLKVGREVTILYPNKDMKDEYLLYVKSITGNSGVYHTLNKYFDIFIDRIEEIRKKKYNNAQFIETMRLSEIKAINVNPIVGTGITFNIK